jgi:hypothetical protein
MRLSYVDLLGDRERHLIEARVTTDHAASSYGIPVVVLPDGESLSIASWMMLNYQVEEATSEELEALERALSPYTQPTLADAGRIVAANAGRSTSERKAAAARSNGRRGGRPRKNPPVED